MLTIRTMLLRFDIRMDTLNLNTRRDYGLREVSFNQFAIKMDYRDLDINKECLKKPIYTLNAETNLKLPK